MSDARKRVVSFFVHPEERRLRAPFRLLVHALSLAVCAVPAVLIGFVLHVQRIAGLLALNFLVIVPPTVLVALLVDRRSVQELGVPTTARSALGVLTGSVLGAGLIGGIALIEATLGLATYTRAVIDVPALVLSTAVFAMVAIHEELLFRGYYLTNLAEAFGGATEGQRRRGLGVSTVLTSLVFGAVHLGNPNMTWIGATNIALAGLFLAMPFVLRGDLGVSIGLHFGWNLAQSWLGMAVSGNEIAGALTSRELHGPEWITGGPVGAEGGALGTGAVVLGTVIASTVAWFTRDPSRAAELGQAPVRTRAR